MCLKFLMKTIDGLVFAMEMLAAKDVNSILRRKSICQWSCVFDIRPNAHLWVNEYTLIF